MTKLWKQWEGQIVNGKFPLRRYLGASDHSAVFLTEYAESGAAQRAAIKLILTDAENAELQLSRWELVAKLSHPRLIQLFQKGRSQLGNMELLYVVMEYAEEDLSTVLSERPLTPEEVGEMLEPVLDALAYIHSKGFAHGHIKPANIMAVSDQLKISSDGICPIGESVGRRNKLAAYDSPEISVGVSPAGDVWSLGVTLVEALTQHRPVWNEHQLEELFKRIPDPFLDIARNCLKRDPQKRWTVANCLARLGQTGDTLPNDAAPSKSQAAVLSGRYVVPVIGVVLVLAAILAAPRMLKRQPDTEPTPSTVIEQPVQRGDDGEEVGPSPQSAIEPERSEGGIIPLEVVEQVLPEVPKSASDTIQGTVRVSVKVTVNASGDVAEVELDTPGPSRYFANLALQAAQHWKFAAAKSDRRDAPREVILRFEFTRTATRGVAAQVH